MNVEVHVELKPMDEVTQKYLKRGDSSKSASVEKTFSKTTDLETMNESIKTPPDTLESLKPSEPPESSKTEKPNEEPSETEKPNVKSIETVKLNVEEILSSDPILMDLDFRENSIWNPDHIHDDNYKQQVCANLDTLSNNYEKDPQHENKRAILKFAIDCPNYFDNSDIGPGDWLVSIYAMRLAALTHGKNADIYIECDKLKQDDKQKTEQVLPWVMGYWPALSQDEIRAQSLPSFDDACGNYNKSPTGFMTPFIQFELRRMAVAIAGIPSDDHPSAAFAEEYLWSSENGYKNGVYQIPNPQKGDLPLVPNLELDDVAIQFTCSVNLAGKSYEEFGFFQWKSYKHRISPDTRSIGIISNNHHNKVCQLFTDDLAQYLRESFPNARVTVRNDQSDTLAIVYTRLIMAKQTFAGATGFGTLPVVASFGTGYIVSPKEVKAKNKWITLASTMYDNIELMDDDSRLKNFHFKSRLRQRKGNHDSLLYFLRTDDVTFNHPYPPEIVTISNDVIIKNADLAWNSYWWGDAGVCENMDMLTEMIEKDHPTKRAMLNFTIDCNKLFHEDPLGTGNWISAIYGIRLAALTHGNIDVNMACTDGLNEKTDLIIPWLMGKWPARKSEQPFPWPHPDSVIKPWGLPTMELACGNYDKCPIGYMAPFMHYELQRMAVAIVGIPDDNHPSAEFAKKYLWSDKNESEDVYQIPDPKPGDAPLVPGIELDEVAIHFRCGDIMGGSHPSFGFMKFTAYKKWVSPEAKTIGIVTGPFKKDSQTRGGVNSRCEPVVLELKKYLEQNFPSATVSIRNDGDETIALAYARLIMAKQTFASITSFGVFPVVGTFGTGYIKKPDFPKVPNKWIPLTSEMYDNLIMMDEPELVMAGTPRGWLRQPNGMERIIYWFTNENYKVTDPYPPQR